MPAFLAFFLGTSLPSIVFRVFSLLGIGIVSYTGLGVAVDQFTSLFVDYSNDLASDPLGILGYLNVDRAFQLIMSAYSIRFTVQTSRKFLGVRQ